MFSLSLAREETEVKSMQMFHPDLFQVKQKYLFLSIRFNSIPGEIPFESVNFEENGVRRSTRTRIPSSRLRFDSGESSQPTVDLTRSSDDHDGIADPGPAGLATIDEDDTASADSDDFLANAERSQASTRGGHHASARGGPHASTRGGPHASTSGSRHASTRGSRHASTRGAPRTSTTGHGHGHFASTRGGQSSSTLETGAGILEDIW